MKNRSRFLRRALLAATAAACCSAVPACRAPRDDRGIAITGTLLNASGSTAPLTLSDQVLGSGFTMAAVLDGEEVTGSGAWHCYAPDPPNDFLQFDIEASDGATWGFFLSINPAVWGTGSTPIDGENVILQIATDDRFGAASGGNLTLIRAPEADGQPCGFSISSNVHLIGEKDD